MRKAFAGQAASVATAVFAAILAAARPCAAITPAPGERIVSFTADLTVRKDTSVDVREQFVVHSEETYFKWGLVRYLPIGSDARWDDRFGGGRNDDTGIRVTILEVTEDGAPVWYEQGSGGSYAQLRIGKFNVPLARGDHQIVIRYTVDGGLHLLADRDELYWNVLGHYWTLPVDEVNLHVRFPETTPIDVAKAEAYAGRRGVIDSSNPQTEITREASADDISYRAIQIGPAQSLSVDVSFPKGIVMPPRMGVFARNRWLLASPIVIFLYYLIVWVRIGPDPALGSVPVRYEPPEGLSPAAVRYIRTTGCDGRTLAAVLAQLAVRECLNIDLENGAYKLTQAKAEPTGEKALAPEESRVLELLFEDGPTTIVRPSNSRNLNVYVLGISGQLEKRLAGKYVTSHLGYVALGFLMSLAFAMGMTLTAKGRDTTGVIFLTWWFFFCASIVGLLTVTSLIPATARAIRGLGGAVQVLPAVAAMAVFGAAFVFILRMLAKNVSPTYSLVLAALVGVNLAWAPFLKRLTAQGRQAMRDIEGFRLFLEKAERDQMQRLNAAGAPLEAASALVPFAIALEVKEAWGDHLAAECFAAPTTR
ncbi:MAG: DUF2207 domain-containing protein [Acidobacteriia bacterium]|nr:DUF2207 domain-containing protein [Terriglobia bacterium]